MKDGMDKHWIVPRVEDKELLCVGHQLASCSLPISYVLIVCSATLFQYVLPTSNFEQLVCCN